MLLKPPLFYELLTICLAIYHFLLVFILWITNHFSFHITHPCMIQFVCVCVYIWSSVEKNRDLAFLIKIKLCWVCVGWRCSIWSRSVSSSTWPRRSALKLSTSMPISSPLSPPRVVLCQFYLYKTHLLICCKLANLCIINISWYGFLSEWWY